MKVGSIVNYQVISGPIGMAVSVDLSNRAYVYLIDDYSQLQLAIAGSQFRGHGGWATRTPVRMRKPSARDAYLLVFNPAGSVKWTTRIG
jgi:hypothetical protein